MPLQFLLDEHFRGLFYRHVQRYNTRHELKVNVVRLGDSADLPLGLDDRAMLEWAEREGRILVSLDGSTLPNHLAAHLAAGHHSPGILLVRRVSFSEVVEFLAIAAHASESSEWGDKITFIP
jgi:hypothetical protein